MTFMGLDQDRIFIKISQGMRFGRQSRQGEKCTVMFLRCAIRS